VTPDARREASVYLRQAFEMSERQARRVIRTDRTRVRQQASQPDDEELRKRAKSPGEGASVVRLPPSARAVAARRSCGQ
jgi:hypothetical protein